MLSNRKTGTNFSNFWVATLYFEGSNFPNLGGLELKVSKRDRERFSMEHTTFTAHKSNSMKWVPKSPLFYCHARYQKKMFCYKIPGYFSPATVAWIIKQFSNLCKSAPRNTSHCLCRFLDGQKTPASNLVLQAFGGFIGTYNKTKQKNQFSWGLFRKSPFGTFHCTNPGFGGPWDML